MAAGSRSSAEERHDEEALELTLRLRTGSSSGSSAAAAAEEAAVAAAARRRSMTIFYNGRVCAVDVTELQVIERTAYLHNLPHPCTGPPSANYIMHALLNLPSDYRKIMYCRRSSMDPSPRVVSLHVRKACQKKKNRLGRSNRNILQQPTAKQQGTLNPQLNGSSC
jgi:hypothetical protein